MRHLISSLLLPPSVGRCVVNGELISQIVPEFSQDNPCFVQTPTTLYAASRLYPKNTKNIFYLPYLPRIRETKNTTYFQGISQREHKNILKLVRPAKDQIVSIDTIGNQNKTGADWWGDWYGLQDTNMRSFDVIWKYNCNEREDAKLATYIVEARNASVFRIDRFAKQFSKIFLSVHVMAIVDHDEEILEIRSLLKGIKNLSLQIVDRRDVPPGKRWNILLRKGLDLYFKKMPVEENITQLNIGSVQKKRVELFDDQPKTVLRQRKNLLEKTKQFTQNLSSLLAEQDSLDAVLSFDVLSAVAGGDLARKYNNVHVVDVNEAPNYEKRVGKGFTTLKATELDELITLTQSGMKSAKASTSSSVMLGSDSEQFYGVKNYPVRSFHEWGPLINDGQMKRDFNLPDKSIVLVHCCTLAEEYGSDLLIDVVEKLPEMFHLVIVGKFINGQYKQGFEAKLQERGLTDRIHLKGLLDDPSKYISYLSQADIGLIILDPAISTVSNGLSNRFVDLMAAGRPIVSTPATESEMIITKMGLGKVADFKVADIVERIYQISKELQSGKDYKKHSELARKKYSAAEERKRFQLIFNEVDPKNFVLFIFQRGLANNKRILRLANYLIEDGRKVVIASGIRPPEIIREKNKNITFLQIPSSRPWRPNELVAEQELLLSVGDDL